MLTLSKIVQTTRTPRLRHAKPAAIRQPVIVETEQGYQLHVTVQGNRYRLTSPGGLFDSFEFEGLRQLATAIHGNPVPVCTRMLKQPDPSQTALQPIAVRC